MVDLLIFALKVLNLENLLYPNLEKHTEAVQVLDLSRYCHCTRT